MQAGILLTGPGLADLDLSLSKSTTIREGLRAQFRAEFFNVLNRANFTTPNAVVYSAGPTPKTPTAAAQSPTAGVVTRNRDYLAADSIRTEVALLVEVH